MFKKCTKCEIEKEISEFNKRSNSKDGYRFECKSCQKLHYENNREYYISKMKENRNNKLGEYVERDKTCLLYTSPSPRDRQKSRMPSSA